MVLRIFNQYIPLRKIVLVACESFLIFGVLRISVEAFSGPAAGPGRVAARAVLIACLIQVTLYYYELYDLKIFRTRWELLTRLPQALGASTIVLALVYFLCPELMIGRGIFIFSLPLIAVAALAWRTAYMGFLRASDFDLNVLIIGTGPLARSIASEILNRADSGFKVAGFVSGDGNMIGRSIVNPRVLGGFDRIEELSSLHRINRIVVAAEERRNVYPVQQLLECKMKGILVEDGIEFYEHLTGKIKIEDLHPSALIFSEGFRRNRWTAASKRAIELAFSLGLLLLLFPLLLAVALIIRADSPGPVLYRQLRVGKGGKSFELLKFRTMVRDAEKDGPVWAAVGDARITRAGKRLRESRIDEIPQLINVIRGDMSFVGPRPERPDFTGMLAAKIPYYEERFRVRPGVTGWAQVRYRYGASVEDAAEKLRYDLYYIKNLSFSFDLYIIFETLKIVLFGKGAR
ncbi:MAG TPA: TIGR03013 family PEP-CTERM/XrtA system glycosyltransferase [Syntrophales bacterium]|nr:TIGR03013 family PEP-CTERM/XrtA system glycosyltransferase [Syntrophales bacterium]